MAEARRREQHRQQSRDVVARGVKAVEELDGQKRGSADQAARAAPVGDVQFSGGAQYAMHLPRRQQLVTPGQVVEEEARQHAVEALLGIGQGGRSSQVEGDVGAGMARLAPRDGEHRGIGIERPHLHTRLSTLRRDRKRPGAAADVQHLVPRLDCRLFKQGPLERPLARGQSDHAVVQRCEQMKAQRGRESVRPFHQCASSSRVAPLALTVRRGLVK